MVPRADAFDLPSHDADLDGSAGVAGSVVLGTLAGAKETRNDRSACWRLLRTENLAVDVPKSEAKRS